MRTPWPILAIVAAGASCGGHTPSRASGAPPQMGPQQIMRPDARSNAYPPGALGPPNAPQAGAVYPQGVAPPSPRLADHRPCKELQQLTRGPRASSPPEYEEVVQTLVAACVGPYLLVGERLDAFRAALGTKIVHHANGKGCWGKLRRSWQGLLLVGKSGLHMMPYPCRGEWTVAASPPFASTLTFANPPQMEGWLSTPSSVEELFK